MREVAFSRAATRDMARLPLPIRATVETKLRQLASDPATLANMVKRLAGQSSSRLRVGDWRVIFEIRGGVVHVDRIAHRREAYRRR